MRRIRRTLAVPLVVLASFGACAPFGSDEEQAATAQRIEAPKPLEGRVSGTGGLGLRIRLGPSTNTAQIGTVPDGARVVIDCQIRGEAIAGNDVWDLLRDRGGYVSDAHVVTGYDGFVPGARRCKGEPPPRAGSSSLGPSDPGGSIDVAISGPPVRAHVQRFANDACGSVGTCEIGTREGHHPTADRALDLMISALGTLPADDFAEGDRLAAFALQRLADYRIWYVIFRQRINYGSGWEPMEDRGSITENHFDHVHVSFWE